MFGNWIKENRENVCLLLMAIGANQNEEDFEKAVFTAMNVAYDAGVDATSTVQLQDDYDSLSVPELAAELKRLKINLEIFDNIKKSWQKAYDYLSIEILPDRMDEEDIVTMKIDGVGRLQMKSDIRCSVPAANKAGVQEWLQEHGHGSMISPAVNASTLKAFVKEMMKENKEWPNELLIVHPYSRATVVKS